MLFWLLFWLFELNLISFLSFSYRLCLVFTKFPLLFLVIIFESQAFNFMIYSVMTGCLTTHVVSYFSLSSVWDLTWKFSVSIFSDQDDFPLSCPWQRRVLSQIISKIPLFFPQPLSYFSSLWKREREESISIECDWHECCNIRIWVHFCQFSLLWVREVTLESNSGGKWLD